MTIALPLSLLVGYVLGSDHGGGLRSSRRKWTHNLPSSPQQTVLLDDVSCPHMDAVLFSPGPPKDQDYWMVAEGDSFTPRRVLLKTPEEEEPQQRVVDLASEPPRELKQPVWPHEDSDIPLDPAITYGELENGMRYYVRSNSEPPGQMEIRLHIDAGANFETEDERGMAHFLEHMMFQTTQNWPVAGTLIPDFQRSGIGLGSHLNAYTNMQETVYKFALPNLDNQTLSTGFTWMKDILDGALLEEQEIEDERRVVVSELQVRDSVKKRLVKELYQWLLPKSLISQRFVMGTEETIMGMTREMFVNFYQKYYVPRRATFIAVGDMNATDMVALIEQTFAGVSDASPRGEEANYGAVEEGLGLRTNVFVDKEVVGEQITMNTISSVQSAPDTRANRLEALSQSMANRILSDRLRDMRTVEGSVIRTGSASSRRLYDFAQLDSVTVVPKEGLWREAVAVMEQEWRRVIEHGFTQFEVDEAKARRLNAYEQRVLSQESRQSDGLADSLNSAVNGGYVVATPEENLRIVSLALASITPKTLHEAFSSNWNTTDVNVYLTTDVLNGTMQEVAKDLGELLLQSQRVPVDPPVEQEAVVFAYTDFGTPGTVTNDSFIEDLAIRQLVLSNNVRVNMKQTDFKAGSISLRARFGSGQLSQPKNATFLKKFTDFVFSNGALGEHTFLELGTVLAGKTVGFSFSITEGDFVFSGGANRDDLELALQLMTAHFTDPAFREEVVGWWQDKVPSFLESTKHSLGGTYRNELFAWLLGGDERFTAPTEEELLSYVASNATEWLVPFLNSSYLEFSIIGDFNETATLDLLLRTIGSLPERDDTPAEIAEEDRAIDIPPPQTKSFTYESNLPKAGAWVVWRIPSDVSHDIELSRQWTVLAGVFRDRMRMKIRDELGGAYSPGAAATRSDAFEYGFFIASSQGLPEEIEVFTDIILRTAANITTGDITEDEFIRALVPFQSVLEDTLRDNGYWLNVMDQSQAHPYQLDWARGRDAFYEAMTVDQINALAMQYLSPDVAYPLSIFPFNGTGTAELGN